MRIVNDKDNASSALIGPIFSDGAYRRGYNAAQNLCRIVPLHIWINTIYGVKLKNGPSEQFIGIIFVV